MGNCGSIATKPCLSESDDRYDADFPQTILGQDARWEKLSGYFFVNITRFDAVNGGSAQPAPYIPGMRQMYGNPFRQDNIIGFYNHTIAGSRLIVNRYYFRAPAPESFCQIPFEPPLLNAEPGSECGVNGFADFASYYASLNHEHDGTLTIGRSVGVYGGKDVYQDADPGSFVKLVDDNTFERTFVKTGYVTSALNLVFFDDDMAVLSNADTITQMKLIGFMASATLIRLSEEEFLAGIDEHNVAFNVPKPIQTPMTSDEVTQYNGTFPTEEQWCGELMNDVSCTTSPYQEPDAQLKGGFVALIVILGVLVFGAGTFLLHRDIAKKQQRRYKEQFVRGIAKNITISDAAGRVDPDQLKKEFDFIDKDKGGTISKDELKEFIASGKIGEISDKDVEAMWHAIDIDNSGEVDFVEFISFLGSCGSAFDQVNKEQRAMTKDQKLKYASQRLSTRVLSVPIKSSDEVEDVPDKANAGEEGV